MVTDFGEPSKSGFHYLRITLPSTGEAHGVSPWSSVADELGRGRKTCCLDEVFGRQRWKAEGEASISA